MKILMLYPEFPDTFWSFKHALPFIRKKVAQPPLGLITVAALLPQDWEVRLIDLNVKRVKPEEVAWADYAMVSAMTVQRESARKIIALCKEAGTKVIAGGPLFSSEHDDFPDVSHFILGEAEVTLPPFLADLVQGNAKHVYQSGEFADMRTSPIPRFELLDLGAYAFAALQTTRGCPFRCDFCDVTQLFGRDSRMKSPEQTIAELNSLREAGWRGPVFFVDDNIIGNKTVLKKFLLPALVDWQREIGYRMPFVTEASINLAQDDQLIAMMAAAGFNGVFIGIETPNDAALRDCQKSQNVGRDMVADVQKLHAAGLEVKAGFIVGFDRDDVSIFQRQIDFIMQSGITTAMVGMLNAPFGTALWKRLKEAGRITGNMSGDNVDGTTNIVPVMDLEVLKRGYRQIMEHLYSPEQYYKRVRTFLRQYRPTKVRAEVRLQHILAFFRACWHLGLAKNGRWQFWKLILWAAFRDIKSLPRAVSLAINGHHFRQVTKKLTQ